MKRLEKSTKRRLVLMMASVGLMFSIAAPGYSQSSTATPASTVNGRITFTRVAYSPSGFDIFTMNMDGSDQVNLTPYDGTRPNEDTSPAWSPDGARIAFVSNRDGNQELYTMNPDGSGVVRLTNTPSIRYKRQPAWSPDGTRIAFSGLPSNTTHALANIYVINLNDGGVRQLTTQGSNNSPSWSPDGNVIAFESFRDSSTSALYVMNADGSNQRIFFDTQGANDSSPAWSPDGTRIAFAVGKICVAPCSEIYVVGVNGNRPTRLTDPNLSSYSPAWSPDNRKVAFSGAPPRVALQVLNPAIYVMNADGSDVHRVSNFDSNVDTRSDYDPDWWTLAASSTAEQWEPAPPNSTGTEISTLISNGAVYARVKLTFPNAGYRVTDWGQVVRTGSDISVDAKVERWTGGSAQVITIVEHLYELGELTLGTYSFTFKSYGALFKTQPFTVNSTPPVANAVDDPAFFVRQHYLDFLDREPESQGFNAWVGRLSRCPAGNASCDPIEVSASFFRSEEFQIKGYWVYRFYTASLGLRPGYAGFVTDMRRVTGQTPEERDARKDAFTDEWMARPEFRARYDGLSNAGYVDALLQTAGVTLAGRDQLVGDLDAGRRNRAQVLRAVVESPEVYSNEYNGAFVTMQYFGYLRRDPEPDGYDAWLRVIIANPQDYRTMVWGFVTSVEYRKRFGQP